MKSKMSRSIKLLSYEASIMRIRLLSLFMLLALLAPLTVLAQSISIGPNGIRVGEEQHSREWYRQHGYHWYNDRWYSAEEWQGMRGNVQGNEGQHSSEWYQRHNYHWANDHWYSEEEWEEYRQHHRHHHNDDSDPN